MLRGLEGFQPSLHVLLEYLLVLPLLCAWGDEVAAVAGLVLAEGGGKETEMDPALGSWRESFILGPCTARPSPPPQGVCPLWLASPQA